MKNKKNNKGFSLVELIVVVAIMAVLVGVLAPAYLSYVEKSRLQKDNSAIAEVCAAIQVAVADEECYDEVTDTEAKVATITKANGVVYESTPANITADVAKVVAAGNAKLTSKTYASSSVTVSVVLDGTNVKVVVDGYVSEPGASVANDVVYPTGF